MQSNCVRLDGTGNGVLCPSPCHRVTAGKAPKRGRENIMSMAWFGLILFIYLFFSSVSDCLQVCLELAQNTKVS